jgi:TrmH family RNA methyltransferase
MLPARVTEDEQAPWVSVKIISSRQHVVVREFRALGSAPDPTGARLLLDGAHLVHEALRADTQIEIVAVAASRIEDDSDEGRLARELTACGIDVVAASDSVLEAMSPVRTPSGVVAIVRRAPTTVAEICERAGFIVAAVDVQDPGNLGSLIRAAEAGGVSSVLVCGASASPFSWKAVRGSMGSVLRVPVATVPSVDGALRCMKARGLHTIAAVARHGTAPDVANWSADIGLLVGGEAKGLDENVAASCDERVTIPMCAPVESLNVAVAGAILIYAARRQRI